MLRTSNFVKRNIRNYKTLDASFFLPNRFTILLLRLYLRNTSETFKQYPGTSICMIRYVKQLVKNNFGSAIRDLGLCSRHSIPQSLIFHSITIWSK